MGGRYSPNIVTSGLVLCLDAANVRSYPGSGTTWNDLSGNGNHGTLTNGPTFDSENGGSIVFDGVNDYVVVDSSGSYSAYTFMFFCRWISSTTNSSRIFGLNNFGTYTILNPSNIGFHYNPLGGSPPSVTLSSGVNVGFGTWCHVAVSVSSASTAVKIYVNGILRNTSTTLPSGNFGGNVYLGAQNTISTVVANANIATFHLFNRALTDTEILQNFNAHRERFGI
jgi:hypothetical protein